jgi:putative glutathione S-transferase
MGLLVDGHWQDQWYDTKTTGGAFQRTEARFRDWIGTPRFPAEPGRYRLYVSLACPWAHRTLIVRALKGLEDMIPIAVVHWHMAEHGWTFEPGPGVIPDPDGARYLYEVYLRADPAITTRVTVPILWDTQERTIVNNESSEIIRMLNSAFDHLGAKPGDFYPQALRPEIDALNARIYDTVNNGVYKAGFATTQRAYEDAVIPLFDTLDWLDRHLAHRRYLCGDAITEADWRLFTTLLRFDAVYVGHFKCNIRRLTDYRNLWGYARDLYAQPGVQPTVNMQHIKGHYYMSHPTINPHGIIPAGPIVDWDSPHIRARGVVYA